ncbi:phosphotransferase [Microlunatus speluncae]|uniref:phosphotransferase n=1 Tax=Microlunatus speluncae TaxID=2594267 RepID=UPI0012666F16|nr:phosphotransferase [Microlunatus speluncae]
MSHPIEFRLSENPWAPTAVVEEINARTGSGLVITGLADQIGGVSSAAFVAWPDGRQSALTRPRTPLALMRLTATVLGEARAQGLPVPTYQLVLQLDHGYLAVVQERLPGRHVETLDRTTVAAFVAMNERFAGLLRRHPEVPPPPAFPADGPGYGAFEDTIGGHSRRGRRLLTRLLAVDGGRPLRLAGDDLVHVDYSPGNVLFDESGRVSGVVDWNFGAARGDRRYALIGLAWGSVGRRTIKAGEQACIDAALAELQPATRRSYEAHWAAYNVHRSIVEGFSADRILSDLAFAEALMS